MKMKSFLATVAKVSAAVGPVVRLIPGGAVVEEVIELASNVAAGLEVAEPAAEAVWTEIQAAANGGPAPTAAQFTEWRTRAAQVHAAIQAL